MAIKSYISMARPDHWFKNILIIPGFIIALLFTQTSPGGFVLPLILGVISACLISSANYLIAHRDGEAINVEAAPGDYGRVYVTFPEETTYAHTNHFMCPKFDLNNVEIWSGPGSLFRERRACWRSAAAPWTHPP